MDGISHETMVAAIRTLDQLDEKITRYHDCAANGTNPQFGSRMEWNTMQMEIRELRDRLQDGNQELAVFENGIERLCTDLCCDDYTEEHVDCSWSSTNTSSYAFSSASSDDFPWDRSSSFIFTESSRATKSRLGSIEEESPLSLAGCFGDLGRPHILSLEEEVVTNGMVKQLQLAGTPVSLYCKPPHPSWKVPRDAALRFTFLSRTEYPKTSTDWLRCAVWWLLKSRSPVLIHRRSTDSTSICSSIDPNMSHYQAFVDLQKASWIVFDVILRDAGMLLVVVEQDQRLLDGLINAFESDFRHLEPFRHLMDDARPTINYGIWEYSEPTAIRSSGMVDTQRWIDIRAEDAGHTDEVVMFRGFVNLRIGRLRNGSTGAPYLLVVSGCIGDSEPSITLCNQTGTLYLSRYFERQDLQSMQGVELAGMLRCIPLKISGVMAFVEFIQLSDYEVFRSKTSNFFDSVVARNLRDGETREPLFREVLEYVEDLQDPSILLETRGKHHFCELRVLETRGERAYGWQTSRRLVLTSAPYESYPWSKSFFLPMSNVRLERTGSRDIVAKWSDISHTITRTLGDYVPRTSYVYDGSSPTRSLRFVFRSSTDATKFEQKILGISIEPDYTWVRDDRMTAKVFALRNERKSSQYKLLHLTERSGPEQSSRIFYISRTTDIHITPTSLHLPNVLEPDYISNHIDLLHEATTAVELAKCSQKPATLTLEHASPLLSGLTPRWRLLSTVHIPHVAFREAQKSRFRFLHSPSPIAAGTADLSLWRRSDQARLLVRWINPVCTERWISATLPVGVKVVVEGGTVLLALEEMTQGSHWDLGSVSAVGGEGVKGIDRMGCEVEVEFVNENDRQAFCTAIRSPERAKHAR